MTKPSAGCQILTQGPAGMTKLGFLGPQGLSGVTVGCCGWVCLVGCGGDWRWGRVEGLEVGLWPGG